VVAERHSEKAVWAIAGWLLLPSAVQCTVYTVDEQEQARCCVSASNHRTVEFGCIFIFRRLERKRFRVT